MAGVAEDAGAYGSPVSVDSSMCLPSYQLSDSAPSDGREILVVTH